MRHDIVSIRVLFNQSGSSFFWCDLFEFYKSCQKMHSKDMCPQVLIVICCWILQILSISISFDLEVGLKSSAFHGKRASPYFKIRYHKAEIHSLSKIAITQYTASTICLVTLETKFCSCVITKVILCSFPCNLSCNVNKSKVTWKWIKSTHVAVAGMDVIL